MSAQPANLTPWFPPNVKPVHIGVYLTKIYTDDDPIKGEVCGEGFSYWSGHAWSDTGQSIEEAAARAKKFVPGFQNKPWRGLAKKPKKGNTK